VCRAVHSGPTCHADTYYSDNLVSVWLGLGFARVLVGDGVMVRGRVGVGVVVTVEDRLGSVLELRLGFG